MSEQKASDLEKQGRKVVAALQRQERELMQALADVIAGRKAVQTTISRLRRAVKAGNAERVQRELSMLMQAAELMLPVKGTSTPVPSSAPRRQSKSSALRNANSASSDGGNGRTKAAKDEKPKIVGIAPHAKFILFHALSTRSLGRDLTVVAEAAYENKGGLTAQIPVLRGRQGVQMFALGDELARGDDSTVRHAIGSAVMNARKYQAGDFNSPKFRVHPDLVRLSKLLEAVKPRPFAQALRAWGVQVS